MFFCHVFHRIITAVPLISLTFLPVSFGIPLVIVRGVDGVLQSRYSFILILQCYHSFVGSAVFHEHMRDSDDHCIQSEHLRGAVKWYEMRIFVG